jgi:hypothetical protein
VSKCGGPPLAPRADRRAQPLGQFAGSDPVDPPLNNDLPIADITAEEPVRPSHNTGMLARQTGVSLALGDTPPRRARWLALRGLAAG